MRSTERSIHRATAAIVGILAGVGISVRGVSAQAPDPEPEETTATAEPEVADADVILEVDGMSCPFCAYGLEKRLKQISAIEAMSIHVSDGLVRIRLVEGATLGDEALREAVKRAGFSLREITRIG